MRPSHYDDRRVRRNEGAGWKPYWQDCAGNLKWKIAAHKVSLGGAMPWPVTVIWPGSACPARQDGVGD